mgnify:CR=1 FL=1
MARRMPYSRDCFITICMNSPNDTFTLAYRFVAFETIEGVTPSMSFRSYKFGFHEHAIRVSTHDKLVP